MAFSSEIRHCSVRLDRLITLNLVRPLLGLRSTRRSLPILMYHSISDDPESGRSAYYRTCTSPGRFAEHMRSLKTNGYHGVTLSDGLRWLNSSTASAPLPLPGERAGVRARHPSKPVAITFDDGFQDFYTGAMPALTQHGFSATMFLPTAYITPDPRAQTPDPAPPNGAFRDQKFLTWSQVRELHDEGIEFGSHTMTHPKLVELPWAQVENETRNSKLELEQKLGAEVRTFAYPYAYPQANRDFTGRFEDLLHGLGYSTNVTTIVGSASTASSPYSLPRLPANNDDDAALFQAKIEGAYNWLAWPQAVSKRLKTA